MRYAGGKVLVPTQEAIQKLVAARWPLMYGRPDAGDCAYRCGCGRFITSDCDPYDSGFITGERTSEVVLPHLMRALQAISRGLACPGGADLVAETSTPDLELARRFADAIHAGGIRATVGL